MRKNEGVLCFFLFVTSDSQESKEKFSVNKWLCKEARHEDRHTGAQTHHLLSSFFSGCVATETTVEEVIKHGMMVKEEFKTMASIQGVNVSSAAESQSDEEDGEKEWVRFERTRPK